MRLLSILGTAALALSIVVPAYGQDQHEEKETEKGKSAREEKKPQTEKSKPEEKKVQQPDRNKEQENRKAERHSPQAEPMHQASGHRIPDDRYRANFGREHSFHVNQSDYRNRRFQYGGYWFGFAGDWPSNWSYTQDVFVVEINGVYYLCNPAYPGVNIMLDVTL